ncbi:VOC family protein [Actinokineospora auranticolor]|uniref:Glyoxalase-like domain-containing protein n=1 Tax=Actinokineospora auranticolor TaxID=155976 RepID=A0A2S6H075_9PSEU|nr:VOC family protein [Actinokineospora auranticolor]PPK70884.1 hypothetical protein CLV40_10170 [Actinokineospora auranticolor]
MALSVRKVDCTLDCAAPAALAEFYKRGFGYEDEPPPPPFATREEWLAQFDDPEDDADDGAWLHHPAGTAPRLFLQQVKEPKVGKIRLHFDFRITDADTPEGRWQQVVAAAEFLTGLGATEVAVATGHHVVLADPEGNEFCVA